MAIVMHLYYSGAPGQARAFAGEMEASGTADRIRAEAGSLQYEYFFPLRSPDTVLLIDAWRDQQALDEHHASPMMGEILRLREKYGLAVRAQRCRTDESGIPDRDQAFIDR